MIHRLSIIATILFGCFIFWIVYLADSGQSMPLFELAKSTVYGDKLGHFLLFGFFAFILNIALRFKGFRAGPVLIPYGALLIFGLVVLEEASQRWFPDRTCDITDLAADCCGIISFSILSFKWRHLLQPYPDTTVSLSDREE